MVVKVSKKVINFEKVIVLHSLLLLVYSNILYKVLNDNYTEYVTIQLSNFLFYSSQHLKNGHVLQKVNILHTLFLLVYSIK